MIIKKFIFFQIYYVNDTSYIKYDIDHGYYDGELFNRSLKNNIKSNKINITEKLISIDNNYNLQIPKHYLMNYARYKNYSKFVSSISFFTKYVLFKYSLKTNLKIGIVINTRSVDNITPGNFVICKSVKININDDLDTISKKISTLISKYKNTNIHSRLITGIDYLNNDFSFNSHKSFTQIQKYGYNFYYNNHKNTKDEFIKLIKEGRKEIILNYNNDYYYINCFKNVL